MELSEEVETETITCLNRLLGNCENCKKDYDNHHPNNYDCQNYIEVHLLEILVE
jgi:hypothetical protein